MGAQKLTMLTSCCEAVPRMTPREEFRHLHEMRRRNYREVVGVDSFEKVFAWPAHDFAEP